MEKHSNYKYVLKSIKSEVDVDREIYFLLSLTGNVEVTSVSFESLTQTGASFFQEKFGPMTSTPSARLKSRNVWKDENYSKNFVIVKM